MGIKQRFSYHVSEYVNVIVVWTNYWKRIKFPWGYFSINFGPLSVPFKIVVHKLFQIVLRLFIFDSVNMLYINIRVVKRTNKKTFKKTFKKPWQNLFTMTPTENLKKSSFFFNVFVIVKKESILVKKIIEMYEIKYFCHWIEILIE